MCRLQREVLLESCGQSNLYHVEACFHSSTLQIFDESDELVVLVTSRWYRRDKARTLTLEALRLLHTYIYSTCAQSRGLVTCSKEHSLVGRDNEKEAWLAVHL
jgi:hypothetical protein